ncbi:MAG: hypothetical protein JW917_04575 [Ignavibacteria bacterium]|nr:hypothetical protein [Ignavibacteria bacterium]
MTKLQGDKVTMRQGDRKTSENQVLRILHAEHAELRNLADTSITYQIHRIHGINTEHI